jgi:hypothetical protein
MVPQTPSGHRYGTLSILLKLGYETPPKVRVFFLSFSNHAISIIMASAAADDERQNAFGCRLLLPADVLCAAECSPARLSH